MLGREGHAPCGANRVELCVVRSDFPVHNLFAHKRNLSSIWLVTDTARRCLEVNRHFKVGRLVRVCSARTK